MRPRREPPRRERTRRRTRSHRVGLSGASRPRSRRRSGLASAAARGGHRALRGAGLPHHEARGLEVHERDADREGRRPCERTGGGEATGAEIEAVVDTSAMEHALVFVNGRFAPELSSRAPCPTARWSTASRACCASGRSSPSRFSRGRPRSTNAASRPQHRLPARRRLRVAAAGGRAGRADPPRLRERPAARRIARATSAILIAIAESAGQPSWSSATWAGKTRPTSPTPSPRSQLGANAQLDHVALERESEHAFHVGTLFARLGRDARFRSTRSRWAALVRNEVERRARGRGGGVRLERPVHGRRSQHVDNQTTIDHAEPHGTSRELYKGVLGGRSKGVFNGKVIVRPGAQKTDAQQSNPNLLLSDGAEIDTRPNSRSTPTT